MIRSEDERGFAFILDKRAFHFRSSIPDLRESENETIHVREFFYGKA
jgi:hypothetical protein